MTRRRIVVLSLLASLTVAVTTAVAADPAPATGETVTTKSGLQYVDVVVGKGKSPKPGDKVGVNYMIAQGGKQIEVSPAGTPMVFTVGKDQALKAMDEGVQTMKVGGKRTLTVPPSLGYGVEGVPGRVPPNAIMTIEMELVEIK